MKEINLDDYNLKINRVEYKCNVCKEWSVNETGLTFCKPTICNKCSGDTTATEENKVELRSYFNR